MKKAIFGFFVIIANTLFFGWLRLLSDMLGIIFYIWIGVLVIFTIGIIIKVIFSAKRKVIEHGT